MSPPIPKKAPAQIESKNNKEDFQLFITETLTVMPVDCFGDIIKFIRKRNNISKREFSHSLGISIAVMEMLEVGELVWSDIQKVFNPERKKKIGYRKYNNN